MINSYTQDFNGKIVQRIKEKRAELINLAAEKGMNNKKVLNCSRDLDLLIYEVIKHNNNMNDSRADMIELRKMDGIH